MSAPQLGQKFIPFSSGLPSISVHGHPHSEQTKYSPSHPSSVEIHFPFFRSGSADGNSSTVRIGYNMPCGVLSASIAACLLMVSSFMVVTVLLSVSVPSYVPYGPHKSAIEDYPMFCYNFFHDCSPLISAPQLGQNAYLHLFVHPFSLVG